MLVVDVHTGLGDFGDYEIIMNDPDNSASFQRARSIWGDRRVKSTVAASSNDIRSESAHVTGTLKRGIAGNLQMQVTAVGLEFGTLPKMVVFKALRAENWAHHHGRDDPRTEEIKECLLRAFYPDSADWKTRVWLQGRDVIQRAIDWLADDTK